MSEDAPDRPLTRRELRLRAMVETGAVPTISDAEKQVQAEAEAAERAEAAAKAAEAEAQAKDAGSKPESSAKQSRSSEPVAHEDDIEIGRYNDDGSPRTRREIRALREQALAARKPAKKDKKTPPAREAPATQEAPASEETSEVEEDPEVKETAKGKDRFRTKAKAEKSPKTGNATVEATGVEATAEPTETAQEPTEVAHEPTKDPSQPPQQAPATPEGPSEEPTAPAQSSREELDPRLADTQPFTVGDLEEVAEAESAKADFTEPEAHESLVADIVAGEPAGDTNVDESEAHGADADGSVTVDADAPAAEADGKPDLEDFFGVPTKRVEPKDGIYYPSSASSESELPSDDQISEDSGSKDVSEAPPEPESKRKTRSKKSQRDADQEDTPKAASSGYSFPDIAPLDENVSVFDRPDARTGGSSAGAREESGDFDDLIHRAVEQESSPRTTNTSALILPNLPNGGLSGPLGETGELFITGSVEMPKSIGETGQQTALHDSSDLDPLDELGFDSVQTTDDSNAPVSARRAVSSTGAHAPIGTEHQKEKSKLPLVLILTGGVLLIAIVGLVTWAATSGMFG